MLAPERRSRTDLVVAVVIAVTVVVAASVAWLTGDARGTTSVTADNPLAPSEAAASVPAALSELWRAPSSATDSTHTPVPVVTGSTVVTGDGGSVVGHDPRSGDPAWSYSRDLPLCSVIASWNTAVSVYRDDRGCSQVTTLDGSTGVRTAQRTSDADDSVYLSSDGTYVTSRGDTRMELWRSDMVRTLEYGRVDAPVNPGTQPRTGCTLLSTTSSNSRTAVLEQCPGEPAARLSLLNPAPKDASEPEEYGSSVVPDLVTSEQEPTSGRVLALTGSLVALYVPSANGAPARIALYDDTATAVSEFALPAGLGPASAPPASPATKQGSVFTWFTGSGVQALNSTDLTPAWSMPGALGSGAVMAGRLLVPVPDAIAVVELATGTVIAEIPIDRGDYDGPVQTSVIGDVVVEQRGSDLVALG
ncbi:PQQ-binding-like beta-propeller repeat protein [Rhodococcus fascians]|nr:PQQ-binding-like beta-propeller repeat protein [Rhodococcus fascians]MBY4112252.1 PQQ-binding-like beta-propeller repeat protein [Rhodococcus fascians]